MNNSKVFDESSKEDEPSPDAQQTTRYKQTVTISFPTTEEVLRYQKWNNQPTKELPPEQRVAAKAMCAKAVLGPPDTPDLQIKEKERRLFTVLITVQMVAKPPLIL